MEKKGFEYVWAFPFNSGNRKEMVYIYDRYGNIVMSYTGKSDFEFFRIIGLLNKYAGERPFSEAFSDGLTVFASDGDDPPKPVLYMSMTGWLSDPDGCGLDKGMAGDVVSSLLEYCVLALKGEAGKPAAMPLQVKPEHIGECSTRLFGGGDLLSGGGAFKFLDPVVRTRLSDGETYKCWVNGHTDPEDGSESWFVWYVEEVPEKYVKMMRDAEAMQKKIDDYIKTR